RVGDPRHPRLRKGPRRCPCPDDAARHALLQYPALRGLWRGPARPPTSAPYYSGPPKSSPAPNTAISGWRVTATSPPYKPSIPPNSASSCSATVLTTAAWLRSFAV